MCTRSSIILRPLSESLLVPYKVERAFKKIDAAGDGSISLKELRVITRRLGWHGDVSLLFESLNKDGGQEGRNASLDWDEFSFLDKWPVKLDKDEEPIQELPASPNRAAKKMQLAPAHAPGLTSVNDFKRGDSKFSPQQPISPHLTRSASAPAAARPSTAGGARTTLTLRSWKPDVLSTQTTATPVSSRTPSSTRPSTAKSAQKKSFGVQRQGPAVTKQGPSSMDVQWASPSAPSLNFNHTLNHRF